MLLFWGSHHVITHSCDEAEPAHQRIVQRYPNQWVLVEETAWDTHGQLTTGIVRAASGSRGNVRELMPCCHHDRSVTTFLFYTGDPIPTDLTVVP